MSRWVLFLLLLAYVGVAVAGWLVALNLDDEPQKAALAVATGMTAAGAALINAWVNNRQSDALELARDLQGRQIDAFTELASTLRAHVRLAGEVQTLEQARTVSSSDPFDREAIDNRLIEELKKRSASVEALSKACERARIVVPADDLAVIDEIRHGLDDPNAPWIDLGGETGARLDQLCRRLVRSTQPSRPVTS